jgi:predicted GTPase
VADRSIVKVMFTVEKMPGKNWSFADQQLICEHQTFVQRLCCLAARRIEFISARTGVPAAE